MQKVFTLFIVSFLILQSQRVSAAPAYAFRVVFKNKNGTLGFADSLLFLSQKSLDRRSKMGIALDSSDLPVVPNYITQVMTASAAVKLHNVSKWFNQIVVITYDSSKVNDILALPMVASASLVARYPTGIFKTSEENATSKFPSYNTASIEAKKVRGTSAYYGLTFQQIDIMQADELHDKGFRGEGMDIAVFDVNFRFTDTCTAFDTLKLEGRIKDVYNFARDTPYVFSKTIPNDHGMNVLSCMAGYLPGTFVGSAPKANYHLYITEDYLSEQPIEEDNWLSAAERCDSLGVYLINSSLGYNKYDAPHASYTYASLNGTTSLIANAANMAVSKGIFVVNAQGNEGANPWHYLITPADADSVYSVGSVDGSGAWASSGYGPTFDQRIKPNGVVMGKAVMLISGTCSPNAANGSSFAAPTLCGAAACLWQSFPNISAFQLRRIIEMSSDRYASPNNTHGYGIPNFALASDLITGHADVINVDYTFSLYPNPCAGSFTVRSFDTNIQNCRYSILDIFGRRLYTSPVLLNGNFTSHELQQYPVGTYIVQILTNNKTYIAKVTNR
jgi:serine protease AprX